MKLQQQTSLENELALQKQCREDNMLANSRYSTSTIREDISRKQIISISLKKFKQLMCQYKNQVISQEDLVCVVKTSSVQHRQRHFSHQSTQIAYLNKIKAHNQQLLKNKIRQLEMKLLSCNSCQRRHELSFQESKGVDLIQQINQIQRKLQEKDIQIEEYRRHINKIEANKRQLQNTIHLMKRQSQKLKQIIQQQTRTLQRYRKQVDDLKSKQTMSKKRTHTYFSIFRNVQIQIYPSIKNQDIKEVKRCRDSSKQEELRQQVVGLYTTNSVLRKQLIKLHDYIQEQDSKYQNKLQYLQNKIKKLTQFNSHRTYSKYEHLNSMNSSTYSTTQQNNGTPRKRNSDMIDYKYINKAYQAYQQERQLQRENLNQKKKDKDKGRIISVADFQIELELANENFSQKMGPKGSIRYKPVEVNIPNSNSNKI